MPSDGDQPCDKENVVQAIQAGVSGYVSSVYHEQLLARSSSRC